VGVLVRMRVRMNLNDDRCMRVWMFVRMVMIVVGQGGIVMVVPPHAVFDAKLTVLAAITRHA
jgi:hypothetical protein